jgi:hypothetical protein
MAKKFASDRGMKRKIKFAFSLTSAIIQYCIEKKQGKAVISKREFVKTYYKKYVELNNTTQNSDQGDYCMLKLLNSNVAFITFKVIFFLLIFFEFWSLF